MELKEIIIERIKKEGELSFCDFMEMALYFPGVGYYTSDKLKIGKQGDFFTTPELTDLFGKLLARQIEEMWYLMNKQAFTIVEYGAGTGKLCADILNALKSNSELYSDLSYCIIEKSETMVAIEKERLHEKVTWHRSINEIPEFCGCVIANEVLDNFSVHRVVMEDELMEIFVNYEGDGFKEILKPASKELKDYLDFFSIELPAGYQAEINLQALEWLREIAAALKKGFVITIDYGSSSTELYKPSSRLGSMLCFHQHQINESFYDNIGRQDITAHVNFSALQQAGLQYGLHCCGYTLQSHFLHSLGLVPLLQQSDISFYPLMMETAGKFRVLIQQKGLQHCFLSGMKFAFSGSKNLNRVALR
jgi:SAM-dependent MidA family methyltransferase